MKYLLIIPGKLSGLNDYIAAERTNRYKGAKMKADNGNIVSAAIRQCVGEPGLKNRYLWDIPGWKRTGAGTWIIYHRLAAR